MLSESFVNQFAERAGELFSSFCDLRHFLDDSVFDALSQEILDSEEVSSLIGETNAFGWSVDTIEILEVRLCDFKSASPKDLYGDYMEGEFKKVVSPQGLGATLPAGEPSLGLYIDAIWYADGDQDPDRMNCGNKLKGKLIMLYREDGSFEYKIDDACLEEYDSEDYEDPSDELADAWHFEDPNYDKPNCDQLSNERE